MVGKKPQVPAGFRQDHGQENPSTVTGENVWQSVENFVKDFSGF